jgi:hypothetical protein
VIELIPIDRFNPHASFCRARQIRDLNALVEMPNALLEWGPERPFTAWSRNAACSVAGS